MSGRPAVAGLVLAAGRSARMEGADKLLLEVGGAPMLRRVVEGALEGGLDPIVVVVGPASHPLEDALADLPVRLARNPDPDQGMSSSLAIGIGALDPAVPDARPAPSLYTRTGAEAPPRVRGAMILLGDMPLVRPGTIRAIVDAFAAALQGGRGVAACVPMHCGRQGNPVLWASERFGDLASLSGDRGARSLLALNAARVVEVPVDDGGVLIDVDDRTDLDRVREGVEGCRSTD